MRNLLKIVLGGLVAFMALAVTQQWSYFSSAWFGGIEGHLEVSEDDEASVVEAVRDILVLLEHYYGTGGDPRFAERIPVSPQVLRDFQADVEYLKRNRRRQEPRLQRLEIVDVSTTGTGRATVRTKEYWIHRIFWLDEEGGEAEPPHSQVINSIYHLSKQSQGWRLDRWEIDTRAPPRAAEDGP